jgi:Putative zinc-finger
MKCEECLPLIEEYVDGELNGRMAERLTSHLSTCARCADEFAELRREQEIYARYQRDIEITPAQWNIVRARIEQERDAQNVEARTRRPEWFAAAYGLRRLFRPAFVAALALIAIGITAGIIYLNSRNRQSDVVVQTPLRNEIQTPLEEKRIVTPDEGNESNEALAKDDKNAEENGAGGQMAAAVNNSAMKDAKQKRAVVAAASSKPSGNRTLKQSTPDSSAQFEEAVANGNNLITGVRRSSQEFTQDFDFEIARHAERAELLLRSFRNARTATSNRALDVSYEKAQSRKLLYQNIALRRDAAARGDQPSVELLNTLEPILLDIANLPKRVRRRDVRPIEQRMEKKEIVAALQVQTLIASN